MKYSIIAVALGVASFSGVALADEQCDETVVKYRQLNADILGKSLPKGRPRSVETVMTSRSEDSERTMSEEINYDACGRLTSGNEHARFVTSIPSKPKMIMEGNSTLKMLPQGWKYQYTFTTDTEEAGKPQRQINRMDSQGLFTLNEQGWISQYKNVITIGSSEQDKSITAISRYHINDKNQLVLSQTDKGPDKGETRFIYNANGLTEFAVSQQKQGSFIYDDNGRYLAFFTLTVYPWALISESGRCQTWDKQGNCTLQEHKEVEIGKNGKGTSRNLETRSTYRYWDDE